MTGTIQLRGSVELAAATADGDDAGKPKRFTMTAYSGAPMKLAGFSIPVVVDAKGVTWPTMPAILRDHLPEKIVGHADKIDANKKTGEILVEGVISGSGPDAAEVVASAAKGFPWQASIGATVEKSEYVEGGQKIAVNGRAHSGPLQVVRACTLREISFVAVGADAATSAAIAAQSAVGGKGSTMNSFDDYLAGLGLDPAAITDDHKAALRAGYDAQRPPAKGNEHGTPATPAEVAAILAKYDAGNPEVVAATRGAHAIGGSVRQVELAALLASRGTGAPNFIGGGRGGDDGGEFLEAALLVKAGHERLAENVLGPRALEMSKRLHSLSMVDLCKESLRLSGRTAPHGRSEMLQAALSTTAMPVALGNVMNKIAEATYKLAPATWRSWCAVRSAANFHDHKGLRPSFAFGLEELAPGGDVAHGSVGEEVYTWAVDTYAKQIAIDRRDLLNDDASVLADLIPSLAKAAGRSLSNLIFRTLLANAGSHFAAGNANYASGGGSALGTTALAAAVQKLRRQVDDDGNNLDLMPAVLLVPPELEVTARGLLQSAEIARSTRAMACFRPATPSRISPSWKSKAVSRIRPSPATRRPAGICSRRRWTCR